MISIKIIKVIVVFLFMLFYTSHNNVAHRAFILNI